MTVCVSSELNPKLDRSLEQPLVTLVMIELRVELEHASCEHNPVNL